jgi:hypothetical protein
MFNIQSIIEQARREVREAKKQIYINKPLSFEEKAFKSKESLVCSQ